MTSQDLTQLFSLFGEGIVYGITLGTLVFIIASGVSAAYNLLIKQS